MGKHSKTTTSVTTLSIAVRSAVFKFLMVKLELTDTEPYQLSKRGEVGRMLYHLLRTPQQDRQYDNSVTQYPTKFTVVVSAQLWWLNGCKFLTTQAVHDFNRQVEDMIDSEFISCLNTLRQYSVKIETKQFAKDFMDLYGFTDEDFSTDKLIKAEYRYRTTPKKKLKGAFPIPNCPLVSQLVSTAARA